MFGFLVIIGFLWLLFKLFGLAFRMTWGFTKIFAGLLMTLAMPFMIVCFVLWGGLTLLLPIVLLLAVFGILKVGR